MSPAGADPGRRLLFLAPFAPRLDAGHGGGRAMAWLLAGLAARNRVGLLYLRGDGEPGIDDALRTRLDFVEEFPRFGRNRAVGLRRRLRKQARAAAALFSLRPTWATHCGSPALAARLREAVGTWKPDVVQAEYHVMGQYLAILQGDSPLRVLNQYEPGAGPARELWRSSKGFDRLRNRLDLHAWERFEPRVMRHAHAVVVFTERDRAALARSAPGVPLVTIPLGAEIPESPLDPAGEEPPLILFYGSYHHPPNVDAARRLAGSIFPRVRAARPDARLAVVGEDPPEGLAGLGVEIPGFVPDLRPLMNEAAVIAAPLDRGGGMRVKILDALAAGKAVVASPLAVEGIGVREGEHVLLAETDEDFARAILGLLEDRGKRVEIATAARAWAERNLGWGRAVAGYEAVYAAASAAGPSPLAPLPCPPARPHRERGTPSPDVPGVSGVPFVLSSLTVAIATLDRPEALARCLDALAAGDERPEEILVIDQGRDERTRAVAEARGAVWVRQEERGLAASRNLALRRASSPIVAVTDDDCVPSPGWVEALRRAFSTAEPPDAVTGPVLPLGPEAPGLFAVSSRTRTEPGEFRGRALPWLVGTGANFAVRREWIERAGGYDPRLGVGSAGGAGEDMDLLYRLLKAGARVRYEPDAVVFHERQPLERRLASRSSYGRGIGACCGLWLRGGDVHALSVLGRWTSMRAGLLIRALRRRRWQAVREEGLVLGGTLGGLLYGLKRGRA
ncbi:MAG: glycosyltransferase [Thermoanaerobaculia bacterium]